ncbi:MAG: PAS domain-containing protein [Chloroflexi bacterium AL-W]|nr:PAS domain-containing protein [Chloroflexi bacterium AL-N1]NOK65870.1 PAS domain-containing protein [Chloroflexi bacterium AL-N10]NOK74189.1 PAS domain-containing protein [Chloroflexi bacterium AL-N5]NOK80903.1 PAS domain-containing protein [Chloroflexi bacterium AL-W]NOK88447.1 PAS domain-containing protein [Chloroflexi bacterium AL-N15]
MLVSHTTHQLSPTLLTALAHVLSGEYAFVARVHKMFELLQQAVPFYDGRLLYQSQSHGSEPLYEQINTASRWPMPWNEEQTRQVMHSRMAVQSADALDDATDISNVTTLSVPVVWAEQLCGVLELRAEGSDVFAAPHQTFIAAMLPLLAAAVVAEADKTYALAAHPQAHTLMQRQEDALNDLYEEFGAPYALNEFLTMLLRWSLDATGAEAGMISLVDHDKKQLVAQVYQGYPQEPLSRDIYGEPRRRWSWDMGVSGEVARSGRPLHIRDVARNSHASLSTPDIRSELAVPIFVDDQVVCVMVLDSPRSLAFGDSELSLIQVVCDAATPPLRRALWYQQTLETSTQLGQVFSSIPDGLALLDNEGRVLRHNPAWLGVWGLNGDILNGAFHVPWDLVPHLLPRLHDPLGLSDFCAVGQSSPTEVQTTMVILRDPHQELHVLSTPTRDSLEQLTGRLWVVSDVTREREADRLKNEFISIVSHELRTPLTSILGYTELLLARDFGRDEQREFVQTVYDQANHLSKIVEDLLGVSRLEAGKVKLNLWVVSLRQLMAEMTAQLSPHLSSRHRVVIDIPQQIPPAYVDRDKIKQILINLLTNAVKYSPRGGEVILKVREAFTLPLDHPEGDFLILSVHDQGLGIPEDDLPHIWERFYRVDNSNTRRIGGTGLGLSITKALVELHGGRIWVESIVNEGSTFFFTIPMAVEP